MGCIVVQDEDIEVIVLKMRNELQQITAYING